MARAHQIEHASIQVEDGKTRESEEQSHDAPWPRSTDAAGSGLINLIVVLRVPPLAGDRIVIGRIGIADFRLVIIRGVSVS